MLKVVPFALSAVAVLESIAFAQSPAALESPGRIEAVTVYRGQALVTRLVDVPGPAGLRELVVTDLPENVLPGTLFAESSDGVEVRSVLYRQRPVTQDIREEVRQLDDHIRSVQDKLSANAQALSLQVDRKTLMEKLEQFTAPTASVELTKGVLNPDALKDMAAFLTDQRRNILDENLRLNLEKRDLEEQLSLLQRQRQELAGSSARTAREALVFVNLSKEGGELRLRYLVDQANWSPSYAVRAGEDRAKVTLEYYASIQQMSGEDWSHVAMTLSTAMPSLIAKAPRLESLHLTLSNAQQQQVAQYGLADFNRAKDELGQRKMMLNDQRGHLVQKYDKGQKAQGEQSIDVDSSLNIMACDLQVLEWASSGNITKSTGGKPDQLGDGLSVTYQLAGRTSLPSRSDRQLIQIASLALQGDFYKLAIPVLTDSIYEESLIANSTETVLLAGPVSTYLAGEFVGHGEIPTVAAGETFTLGFGIDSSLRCGRELYEKVESLQGGNRIVELTYRLTIENFGSNPASIRVMDRKPISNGSDVKSTLVSAKPPLSDDAAYLKGEHKQGMLRWDVQAPAQSTGANAAMIAYQLHLEYDKQMSISGMAMVNGQQ